MRGVSSFRSGSQNSPNVGHETGFSHFLEIDSLAFASFAYQSTCDVVVLVIENNISALKPLFISLGGVTGVNPRRRSHPLEHPERDERRSRVRG